MATITRKELLSDWLDRFPLVEVPVTLGEDTHHAFTETTLPLAQPLIDAFIIPYESEHTVEDEFTEFIPCFRLEHPGDHHVCVWWRVSLMTYEYFLATFQPDGEQIQRVVVAGTWMHDGLMVQRVAHINKDFLIVSSEGSAAPDQADFDLSSSVQAAMLISDVGELEFITPGGHQA